MLVSHLALLRSHVLAHLGAAGAFISGGEAGAMGRETRLRTTIHVDLSVWIVELLLLPLVHVVLTHVHLLRVRACHLAVLLLVARKLVSETNWIAKFDRWSGLIMESII